MDFDKQEHTILFSTLGHSQQERVLHKVLAAVSWPQPSDLKACLNACMAHGSHYVSSPRKMHGAEKEIHDSNQAFWVALVDKYNISLSHPYDMSVFFTWLMNNNNQKACCAIIENTSSGDLEKFLSAKTPTPLTTPAQRTGYDKANELQVLVMHNQVEILEKVAEIYPDFTLIEDKKGRTGLFAVKSDEMLELLLEQKIDPATKNKDGRTALEFFIENKYPQAVSWGEKISKVSSSPEDALVMKLVTFDKKLTQDEDKILKEALNDIGNWRWQGRLGGVDREWSLPEIWKMSEFLFALEETVSPSFNKDKNMYYSYAPKALREPVAVMKNLHSARSFFPSLESKVFNPKRKLSSFEKAVEFLMELKSDHADGDIISYTSALSGDYGSRISASAETCLATVAKKSLEKIPESEKDDFSQAMASLLRQSWNEKLYLRFKVKAYMEKISLPLSLGGFATKSWTDAVVEDRQGTGLRSGDLIAAFSSALQRSRFPQMWEASKTSEATTLSDWQGVLRTGLCYSGVNHNPLEPFMPTFEDMITQGVPMEKVPLRWTRHFTPELKAATSKWIITSSLEKKIQKKAPAPTIKKRRM